MDAQFKQVDSSLTPWLLLSQLPGMHSRLFNKLLDAFQTPENIFTSDLDALERAGLKAAWARRIYRAGRESPPGDLQAVLDRSLDWSRQKDQHILTRFSEDYPPFLAEIPDPPPVLYIKGSLEHLSRPMFAMVGSRNPTTGGRRNARQFAGELAAAGFAIVSGLAMGIDYESHLGALDRKGKTLAVLGTGIDLIYPGKNRRMFERIAGQGALISEFKLGTPPAPKNFPQRNRIISGMSLGVLVVEATPKSGSMITARYALEQGREVFAIPGSIHNPVARGCHRLIKQGAKLVQSVSDIYEEFEDLLSGFSGTLICEEVATDNPDPELSPESRKVKAVIGFDPVSLDEVVVQSGLNVQQSTVALLDLELRGLIHKESGGYILSSPAAVRL